jgi:RimJ/RimL family protein N-acetyltransferase
MQIKVEAASELDFDRLRTLRLAALSDSPDSFGAKYNVEKEKPINFWQNSARISNWCLVSADEVDIGLVAVDSAGEDRRADCWISAWWIQKEFRGKGITQLMLDWIDQLASKKNWHRMGLGVWPDNKQAISAYEKLGFVAGGEPMPSRSIPGLLYLPMFREIGGESNE